MDAAWRPTKTEQPAVCVEYDAGDGAQCEITASVFRARAVGVRVERSSFAAF